MKRPELTQQRIRDLFAYDDVTGEFRRRRWLAPNAPSGEAVGSVGVDGYLVVNIDGLPRRLHRLAFLYMSGRLPVGDVDHINGDRKDNRWENLRDVQRVINCQNRRKARRDSLSGLIGALKKRDRFFSRIKVDGRHVYLGTFDTAEAAHAAYMRAKREMHEGFVECK